MFSGLLDKIARLAYTQHWSQHIHSGKYQTKSKSTMWLFLDILLNFSDFINIPSQYSEHISPLAKQDWVGLSSMLLHFWNLMASDVLQR